MIEENAEFRILTHYTPKGRKYYKVYHQKSNTYPYRGWNEVDCQDWINNHSRVIRLASGYSWGVAALRVKSE